MKTISQRELRNDSAAVLRAVESGETLTVTRRGVPVARLTPIVDMSDLKCTRPATQKIDFNNLVLIDSEISTEEILTEIRDER